MKSRLHKIEITNFKAFREFSLNLEGRHLLVYGPNGSGKSSLYWALYTFLQSAGKDTPEVTKYFDPAGTEHLLNLYELGEANERSGEIALTFRDTGTNADAVYRISTTSHDTKQHPVIVKGDLASDFVTYRFFFGFSGFRNSEEFDMWPLFEKEILPFCRSPRTQPESPYDWWLKIKEGDPNPSGSRGLGGKYAYEEFAQKTADFAIVLLSVVTEISVAAQAFYSKHFAEDDVSPIEFELGVVTPPSASGLSRGSFDFKPPKIGLHLKLAGQIYKRPQTLLNEAKLTQIALSVRFAAALVNLHESDLQLLVLDDLLVSLDMSNRMKVVGILQTDDFARYQQIIMTHDRGLFNEVKRQIQNNEEWACVELSGNAKDGIKAKPEKRPLDKAQAYFDGNNLDEAAQHLRIAAEENAKNYRQVVLHQTVSDAFTPLSSHIKAIKSHSESQLLQRCRKAMSGCKSLNFTDQEREAAEICTLFDELQGMTERVLNPASHWNEVPLYEQEVKKAIDLIEKLEKLLPLTAAVMCKEP